jgi:hypothetical protein
LLNYIEISEKYKPHKVKTLLIAEAPPPNGKAYFYLPKKMNPYREIKNYTSLPATIFYPYFRTIPKTILDYEKLLLKLCSNGIFLLDIYDIPLKIRDKSFPNWINQRNLKILTNEIPLLKHKIIERIGEVVETNITFLLARKHYTTLLKQYFPIANYCSWIDFRIKNY